MINSAEFILGLISGIIIVLTIKLIIDIIYPLQDEQYYNEENIPPK